MGPSTRQLLRRSPSPSKGEQDFRRNVGFQDRMQKLRMVLTFEMHLEMPGCTLDNGKGQASSPSCLFVHPILVWTLSIVTGVCPKNLTPLGWSCNPGPKIKVSWNEGTPKSSIKQWDFPLWTIQLLGYPHLWKPPNRPWWQHHFFVVSKLPRRRPRNTRRGCSSSLRSPEPQWFLEILGFSPQNG